MVLAVALLAACRGSAPAVGGSAETGAATPRLAVEGFLKGVKDQDLQAIGNVWGDHRGAARTYLDREQYETRLVLMQCYLSHDESRLLSGPTQKGDTSVFQIELKKAPQQPAQTTFKLLQGPASRWYVNMVDPLPNFCRR